MSSRPATGGGTSKYGANTCHPNRGRVVLVEVETVEELVTAVESDVKGVVVTTTVGLAASFPAHAAPASARSSRRTRRACRIAHHLSL
jgi:hypothetical protein